LRHIKFSRYAINGLLQHRATLRDKNDNVPIPIRCMLSISSSAVTVSTKSVEQDDERRRFEANVSTLRVPE